MDVTTNSPKVSVVIPLFNQKEYIQEALDSVIHQSYPNVEIIVVNDGSTDDPHHVLEKYGKEIHLINQSNQGLSAARNTGLVHSSGEYIQFLDADDFLHEDKIRLQLEFSRGRGDCISYCEIAQYEQHSGRSYLMYVGKREDMFPLVYNFWHTYPLPIHSMLFKRELFTEHGFFDNELQACEDRYFLCSLIAMKIPFLYFPCIGGFRRLHDKNMNKDRVKIIANTIKYYRKINDKLEDDFFLDKFGFTGSQMMRANLTYMIVSEIAGGTNSKILRDIRTLLRNEDIKFFADPISSKSKRYRLAELFLKSYMKRWGRHLHFAKKTVQID